MQRCRVGHGTDIATPPINVRFTPKSGHSMSVSACPLCAKSGQSAMQQKERYFDPRRRVKATLFGTRDRIADIAQASFSARSGIWCSIRR
jgi:hypothetical protein